MLWLSHINLLCWVMIPETTKYYTHDYFIEALYCRALSHVTHHLNLLAYTNYSGFGWLGKHTVNCVTTWPTNTPHNANVSARPSDAIWRHISGSTLHKAMACYLVASNHYQDLCWLLVSEILWHLPENNSQRVPEVFCSMISLKIIFL